jgi:hypothetical protein
MGWTSDIAKRIIVFVLGLFAVLYVVFPGKIYGIEWIASAIFIFILIISGITFFSRNWLNSNEARFIYKLFWTSFIIRVISMLILLAISYKTWNMFYTVGARDEMVYYRVAAEAVDIWRGTNISDAYSHIFASYKNDISDTGFSTFLMFPIFIFGQSPVIIKIFLCFLGSIIVVRGYKLASMLIEEPAARLAGILLALYPISWFYSEIMLKENVMVFLMVETFILLVKIQRSFKLLNMLKAILFIILLFFFRSALSILLLFVLVVSFIIQYRQKYVIINVILAGVIFIVYIYFLQSTGRLDEYYTQYTNVDEFTQERLSYMEKINPFVALVGSPVFAVLSYISPFPSVVLVPNAGGLPHSEYYYHVAGNLFWIVLAFFSFYGLYYSIRHRRKEMAVLLAFVIGYQFVLLKAMMFTSVRFSYPAKPFLLILAAYGIYKLKSKKWYPVYLVAAVVLIVGWNYVRIKGRG